MIRAVHFESAVRFVPICQQTAMNLMTVLSQLGSGGYVSNHYRMLPNRVLTVAAHGGSVLPLQPTGSGASS